MLKQQQLPSVSLTLSPDTIAALRRQVHGCEMCSPQASMPFAELLARLTGRGDSATDYVMSSDIQCPSCVSPLDADTLVEIQQGIGRAAALSLYSSRAHGTPHALLVMDAHNPKS